MQTYRLGIYWILEISIIFSLATFLFKINPTFATDHHVVLRYEAIVAEDGNIELKLIERRSPVLTFTAQAIAAIKSSKLGAEGHWTNATADLFDSHGKIYVVDSPKLLGDRVIVGATRPAVIEAAKDQALEIFESTKATEAERAGLVSMVAQTLENDIINYDISNADAENEFAFINTLTRNAENAIKLAMKKIMEAARDEACSLDPKPETITPSVQVSFEALAGGAVGVEATWIVSKVCNGR